MLSTTLINGIHNLYMKSESLNILRAVSILGVLIGHGCLQIGYEPVGRFCGYIFVQIFFLLSAYLLGIKYVNTSIGISFLVKRWKRLSVVYYPFLIIVICSILLLGGNVTWKNVFTHFTYTNYFLQDTLLGVPFGHLWYISMMMLCYVSLLVLQKKTEPLFRGCGVLVLLVVTFFVCILCLKHHIPSRIPIVVTSYLIVFKRAKDICSWFSKLKNIPVYIYTFMLLCNITCFGLFLYWNLNDKLLIRDIIVLITACSWLLFFMTALRDIKCGKVLGFISTISFELYLVHHPFVLGDLSWLNVGKLTGNILINSFLAIIVIFVGAFILNKIGKFTAKAIG